MGLVIFVLVVAGRVGAGQGGFVVLLGAGLLLLAVPTSRFLARRMLIVLTVLFGVAPVLWWLPIPATAVGRATVLLAFVAAALGAWVAYGADRTSRLRRLIPECRALDFIPLIAAVMSAGSLVNFFKPRTSLDALTLLTMNWDNASHFNMYYMLRTHGRIIGALGTSPDGSAWQFHNYPQGYHATVALLAEVVKGPLPADLEGELVSYTILSAIVSTLAATLVTAALCSIPQFRRRFRIAVPVVIFVAAGWIYGPGAAATMHGFQNFYVAAALVSAFLVLMVLQVRVFSQPLMLAASIAAAVGVAHNWVLLGTLLIGACAVLVVPWNRRLWAASRSRSLAAVVIVSFGAFALVPALRQLSSISANDVLYAVGGVPLPDFGMVTALLMAAVGMSLLSLVAVRSRFSALLVQHGTRFAAGIWTLAAGLIVLVVMAAAQISKTGALSYYSIKLILALELVALVVLALGIVGYFHSVPHQGRNYRWLRLVAAAFLALGVTQCFGLTFDTRAIGLPPGSTSAREFERQQKTLSGPVPVYVVALVKAVESNDGSPAAYLTTYAKDFDPILAFQWYDALTGTYTEKSSAKFMPHLRPLWSGVDGLSAVVTALRLEDPSIRIIVDPENQELLNRMLNDPK
ncbi:hypothetical protein [Pseudarthrobacter siccitolerans]